METITFFKWLGLTTLFIALLSSAYYWINVVTNGLFPNRKLWFKYKFLRRKFNEDVINYLAEDLENGVDADEMFKAILTSGKATPNQAEELKYIYKELQRGYGNE